MTNQQDNEQDRPARFQDDPATGYWGGATLRECGEHRTVGRLRAWCFDCVEWCYPADGCKGCAGREAQLRRELEALRAKAALADEVQQAIVTNQIGGAWLSHWLARYALTAEASPAVGAET